MRLYTVLCQWDPQERLWRVRQSTLAGLFAQGATVTELHEQLREKVAALLVREAAEGRIQLYVMDETESPTDLPEEPAGQRATAGPPRTHTLLVYIAASWVMQSLQEASLW